MVKTTIVFVHKLYGVALVVKVNKRTRFWMVIDCAVPPESRTRLRHDHNTQEGTYTERCAP